MDITKFWARGVGLSGLQQRKDDAVTKATEDTRAAWLKALGSDELRTWFDVGQQSTEPLRGLLVTLTIAGMCKTHDSGDESHPTVRVIRGAISTLDDCIGRRQAVISADDARALSAAVVHAKQAVEAASHKAIHHAATSMRRLAALDQ